MRGSKRRLLILRVLFGLVLAEGILLIAGATALTIMTFAVRHAGEEFSGVDKILGVIAALCAVLAGVCVSAVLAIRSTMRYGYGALGRVVALGTAHLSVALFIGLISHRPWWPLGIGLPAAFYLPAWWFLRDRPHDDDPSLDNEIPAQTRRRAPVTRP